MPPRKRLRDAVAGIIPFRLFVPLVYLFGALWLLLVLITSPLWILYLFIRLAITWCVMAQKGKDLLVVTIGEENYGPWLSQILPANKSRALFLNYAERSSWQARSLSVRLFRSYGPKPKPTLSMPEYLPTIIVFRRFHRPEKFIFGNFCKDPEALLARLRSALARSTPKPVS